MADAPRPNAPPLYWRFFRWWGWGWGELQIGPVSVNVGWPIQPED